MNLYLSELIGIFCVSLLFSGLFSMLEAAVISQDKHRLQHLADENDKRALIMRRLLARTDQLLSTLLLCNNLANVTCAAAATAIAARLLPNTEAALLWVTLIVTFILLVFSEITPKVIGVRYASAIALALARLLDILLRLLLPLTAIANFCSSCLLRLGGIKNSETWQTVMSFKELRSAVRAAARTSGHDTESNPGRDHYHMLEKTLRFNELTAEKIMTPRRAIHGINLQDDIAAIKQQIEKTKYNKLPIFDGNIDNACGVVDTIDAIKLINLGNLSAPVLRAIAAPINYIPAAAAALQQLQNIRQRQQRLVLVLDGSGRVIGMLTFANFAAAIIGEETPPAPSRRSDGALILPGDTTLIQLEQLQPGSAAPADSNANTLNGIILEYLGDLPPTPLCLKINDWRLEILAMDDKSITQVALLTSEDDSEGSGTAAEPA